MSTPEPEQKRPRNWWIWISGALALVAAGLLIWALTLKSDRDSAQSDLAKAEQQLASTQKELESAKQPPKEDDANTVAVAGALAGLTALYENLADELGTTQEDLASAQQDVDEANKRADQAEQDAADAKKKAEQATTETEKAQAEAEQAQAEQQAAEAKAAVAKDCTRAFLSAFGSVLEADDPEAHADELSQQLTSIADDCKTALAGT